MDTNYCHVTILVVFCGFCSLRVACYRCSKSNTPEVNNNLFINDTKDTIYSPDYSSITPYPPNMNCKWTIEAQHGKIIKLTFTLFVLESKSPTSGCTLDYVRVHDGGSSSGNILGVYCGKLSEFSVKSTGRYLTIVFHSNLFIQRQGFIANFGVETAPDPPQSKPSVPVALIIAGTIITVAIIITIACVAASGKFSFRTRKRARRQLSRSSLGSRVSMGSRASVGSRATNRSRRRPGLAESVASMRSQRNGHPLMKTNSPISIPELILTSAEGKETTLLSTKVETKAVVHSSPRHKRRYRGINNRIRKLSSENVILPTPPPSRRATNGGWSVHESNHHGVRLVHPSSPHFRRHSFGSLSDDVLT